MIEYKGVLNNGKMILSVIFNKIHNCLQTYICACYNYINGETYCFQN